MRESKLTGMGRVRLSRQKGEMPLSPVLMLALIVLPLIIGLIYFTMSAEERIVDESQGLKDQRQDVGDATDRLEKAFE